MGAWDSCKESKPAVLQLWGPMGTVYGVKHCNPPHALMQFVFGGHTPLADPVWTDPTDPTDPTAPTDPTDPTGPTDKTDTKAEINTIFPAFTGTVTLGTETETETEKTPLSWRSFSGQPFQLCL